MLPHSDICGSQVVCTSPQLIAAYHVLLRLLMPRHSPCALISLTTLLGSSELCSSFEKYIWNCFHNIYCRWIFSMFSSFALLLNFFIQFSRYFALKNFHSSWWAQVDSNHRPHAYQACALTTWAMRPFSQYLGCSLSFSHVLWWRWRGSNSWPPACKAGALPAELHPRLVRDRIAICFHLWL